MKNQHLLWRAGFGPAVEQLADLDSYSPGTFFDSMKKASAKSPVYLKASENYLDGVVMGIGTEVAMKKDLTPEERRTRQRQNREGIRNLNLYWMKEMVNTDAQLREKMAFFWHDHFACRNLNVFYQQELLDVLRQNALGDFRTLLKQVSRTAAMLNFLNNQQNRKGHPNENFAREVMELFTIGRGNYTEDDVKHAARAFTGWSANARGEFVFRRGQHDEGVKTVLGKTGNFNGDEVLDILLDDKRTALFIAGKVYAFFVNEKRDEAIISQLANRFYQSGYNIQQLLDDVFTADWFFEPANIGNRIKSPVELLVGVQRMIPMSLENEESMLVLQRILGQVLFYPPNVSGWPSGSGWIDSSTLMMRMRVPQLFNDADELNIKPKDDDDQMMGRATSADGGEKAKARSGKSSAGRGFRTINANLEWDKFYRHFSRTERDKLLNGIAGLLFQTNRTVSGELVKQYSDESSRERFIRTAVINFMSTPEYQLC